MGNTLKRILVPSCEQRKQRQKAMEYKIAIYNTTTSTISCWASAKLKSQIRLAVKPPYVWRRLEQTENHQFSRITLLHRWCRHSLIVWLLLPFATAISDSNHITYSKEYTELLSLNSCKSTYGKTDLSKSKYLVLILHFSIFFNRWLWYFGYFIALFSSVSEVLCLFLTQHSV